MAKLFIVIMCFASCNQVTGELFLNMGLAFY